MVFDMPRVIQSFLPVLTPLNQVNVVTDNFGAIIKRNSSACAHLPTITHCVSGKESFLLVLCGQK